MEYASGYRNDRLHWHLQDPEDGGALRYSEVYRDLQFWQNVLSLTVYHRDVYFFVSGGYGAFGVGGEVRQKYADLSFTGDRIKFWFTPKGWAADGVGHFGYCVNLTDGRLYKVMLIPFVGFSSHWESLERGEGRPLERVADSYVMSSQLPGRLNLNWYGFLLGGAFRIDPGGSSVFDVGYNYSWLHVRFHTHYANEVELGGFATEERDAIKTKTGGNLGHTGWIKGAYRLNREWQVGLGGLLHYFASKDFRAKEEESSPGSETIKIPEKVKIRWTAASGWVSISRSF